MPRPVIGGYSGFVSPVAHPFSLYNAGAVACSVVLSVPHSGRDYDAVAGALRVPLRAALPLEDRYADRLVEASVATGTTTIVANAARLQIDLNRAPDDLDRAAVRSPLSRGNSIMSAKARAGLGLIPTRLPNTGNLWKRALDRQIVDERLHAIHRPYHAAIANALELARAKWGEAFLLDIHSMPSLGGADAPEIVVGDRFGTTAGRRQVEIVRSFLDSLGFRVALNAPYAGGYIVDRHGAPAAGVHAIQLEFDRALYLDAAHDQPSPALGRVQNAIEALVHTLASGDPANLAIAAE